jgi:hypothetical protein
MATVMVTNVSGTPLRCGEYTLLPNVETRVDMAVLATWCRINPAFVSLVTWQGKTEAWRGAFG